MQTSFESNTDSPPVTVIIDGPQKSTTDKDSGLKIVRKGVSYRQRQFVEEKANVIQANISPRGFSSTIWRLPTEILSKIFLYCLPQDQYLLPTPELAPILLTTICQRWREVAVGCSKLWCMLQLEVDHDDWQQRALCYDSWLKRSRGCPLSLKIACYGDLSELQSLLQPYIQQISSLVLDFYVCDGPIMMDDFHALKELTIRKCGFDPSRAVDHSLSKLPANLRKLDMADVLFNRRQLDFFDDSAWNHLTHVEINVHGLDAFPRLLRLCPNLSCLTMFGIFDPIQTPEPVTHTNLQYLHICGDIFWSSGVDLGLFNDITLPNLRLVEARQIGTWPHEEFKAFLARSKCPLESLIFGVSVFSTDQQREEYATLLPSLEVTANPAGDFDIYEFMSN